MTTTRTLTIAAYAAIGPLLWVVPPHLFGAIVKHSHAAAWPLIADALHYPVFSVSMPLVAKAGYLFGRTVPVAIYVALIATSWIFAFTILIDILWGRKSRNLWPIELVYDGALNAPCLIAAWFGQGIRRAADQQQEAAASGR